MSDAEATYLTDVEYTEKFYSDLAPAWLSYIAAINGYVAPRLDQPFTYCELGCGRGVTSLILAATHPAGQFYACDFNPAHIDYAQRQHVAAGVVNLRYYCRSFAQMLDAAELPQFDYICLHGVYSWVAARVREEIREFLGARLKPGGLAMVSYNAMPGWTHLQPVRRMMQAYASQLDGDSFEKARAAYAYADFLAKNGASYFTAQPAAAAHLKSIATHDIRYVVHEYLTPHGDAFYFSDVEADMRGAGLSFAGSMTPAENYRGLMMPPHLLHAIAQNCDRSALETHRDFVSNTAFRRDLYAAQASIAHGPQEIPLSSFDGLAFCLVDLPERLPLHSTNNSLQFDLRPRAGEVRRLHARLQQSPLCAVDFDSLVEGSPKDTTTLLQELVIARHVMPCPVARAASGWMTVNSALVDTAVREHMQEVPLVCPNTGGAAYNEVLQALIIEASMRYHDAATAARSVLTRLRDLRHPVNREDSKGERRPASDDEVLEYASAAWHSLRADNAPEARLLRQLGVLD